MSDRLTILVGANVVADPNAGASGTVWQMNAALRRRGHQVDEIWADSIGRWISHGNLHYLLELPAAYRREVRKACRSKSYDVIELNQPHACLAAADHKRSQRPGIFVNRSHGHETRSEEELQRWRSELGVPRNRGLRGVASSLIQSLLDRQWRDIAPTADGFVVSCTQDADYLRERYDVDANRIGCITQGVPAPFLDSPIVPMTSERLQRFLYIGQLAFFKAPQVLADSVNRILISNPSATMTWVCGTTHHAAAMEMLCEHVQPRVQMIPWMDQTGLHAILDSHGVFLFPSYFEGFGKAPLEAMSRGLCVIATAVGGMRDYIQNEQCGFLVSPGDSAQIADIASRLIQDPILANRVAMAARETAERHTWDRCAADAENFYLSLLERKRAQHGRA
jgi:glycosyltransferase involved in cell wall biosynthesis